MEVELEENFRTLAEESPNMIFINRMGRVVYANKKCEEIMGYKREEFYSPDFDFLTLIAPEFRYLVKTSFGKHMQGEELTPYEYALITKGGRRIDAIIMTRLIKYRQETAILGIVTDITEPKKMEEALKRSEEQYRTLHSNIPVGLYRNTPGPRGRFLAANPAIASMFGYSSVEEFLKANVSDLYETPEDRKAFSERLSSEGRVTRVELRLKKRDGTPFWGAVSAQAIKDEHGNILHFDGMIEDISERKQIEQALQKSEREYRRIFDSSPEVIGVIDGKGNLLNVNRRIFDWLGYEPEEVMGKSFLQLPFLPNGSRAIAAEKLSQTVMGMDFQEYELDFTTKNGEKRVGRISASPIGYEDGKLNEMLVMASDITERKRAEEALRESEAKYSALVEQAKDIVVIVQDGVVKFANKAVKEVTGFEVEEVVGGPFVNWLAPESRDLVVERYKLRMAGEELPLIYEAKIQCKDRTIKDIEMSGGLVKYNGRPADMGIARDISERKRMEEEARKLTQFLNLVVDSADVWLDVLDEKGNVVIWNKAAEKISGYSRDEVVGHGKIWEWLYPDESYRKEVFDTAVLIIKGVAADQEAETKIRTKSGEYKIISWYGRNLVGPKGVSIGSVALGRDITEHKRMEDALRESEEKYRALVENSPDHIGIIQDGYLKYANRALCERSGWTFEEITSPSFNFIEKIVSKKSQDLVKKNIENRLRGEAIPPYEIALLTRDGVEIPAIVSAQRILYQGRPADEFCLVDISERKRMEAELEKHTKHLEELVEQRAKELRSTKDRLQFLLSSSPAMIYTAKPCGDLASTFISENFKDILGYEQRELLENPSFWVDHIHPEDRERMCEEELRVIKDGHGSYEYRFQHKDGRYRWMREEARLVRDAAGNPLEVIGYWIDVTDRKQMEEEVKALNENISRRLLQKISQIENISEVKDRLRTIPDVSTGLDLILDAALSDLGMDAGAILVIDPKDSDVKIRGFKSWRKGSELKESYLLDEGFAELEAAKLNKKISRVIGQDEPSILGTRSINCAPIHFGKEMHGILAFGSQREIVLDNSDLAILGLYSELASTLFETESLTIWPVKEVAEVSERRFELEPGRTYLVKNNVEKAFQVFVDQVLSGAEGLCITREFPRKIREKHGLEKTPIVWLTQEREEDQTTVYSLQDISVMIGNFLQKAKRGVVLLDGFEYLVTNNGFEPFVRFLQLNRSRFEKSESILIAPMLEEALDLREAKLIEREMKPLMVE